MTTILEWAKSVFVLWFAPVALTPRHGWLLPVPADTRALGIPAEPRPTTACCR